MRRDEDDDRCINSQDAYCFFYSQCSYFFPFYLKKGNKAISFQMKIAYDLHIGGIKIDS